MFCAKCGTENATEDLYCKGCGAPLKVEQAKVNESQGLEGSAVKPAKKSKRKGCLITVIVVAVILLVLIIIAVTNGGEASFSTANIKDAVMALEVDPATQEASVEQDVFTQDTNIIYVTFYVKNVPSDTKVSSLWTYIPSGESMAVDPLYLDQDAQVQFSIEMPNGFIPGDYQVELFLDDKLEETLPFTVE
jgi:hypothetical protein